MTTEPSAAPSPAELARTALDRACHASVLSRSTRGAACGTVTVVRVLPHPEGLPRFVVDQHSPLVRHLSVHPCVTVAVPAASPYTALHLTGHARPRGTEDERLRSFEVSLLSLRLCGGAATPVGVDAYAVALPDPLWREAPAILRHLEEAHGDDLLACVQAQGLAGVRAVVPRTVDRYGLELVLLTDAGVGVTRLAFPGGPVGALGEVSGGLRTVLTCRCG